MTAQLSTPARNKAPARLPAPLAWLAQRKTRRSVISVLVVMIGWELIGRFVLTNPLFFAPLSAVFMAAIRFWESGELHHADVVDVEVAGGMRDARHVMTVGALRRPRSRRQHVLQPPDLKQRGEQDTREATRVAT